jgi:alkylhydroperoxidase/carboxymuconolactone decarboxylase family protein YurZ
MKNLISEAKTVTEAFFNLTSAIKDKSVLSSKQNELILIGIFTVEKAEKGLITHIERALKLGATKDEIVSTIILAIPVIGISKVNFALNTALDFIKNFKKED